MRSNYNSAEQAVDKCSAAGDYSYDGYLSFADYKIVFDTIVSSGGLRTLIKKCLGQCVALIANIEFHREYQVRCSASPSFGL